MLRRSLVAFVAALAVLVSTGLAIAQQNSIAGDWQGTLMAEGQIVRVIFHITEHDDGSLSATFDSPDQGAIGIPFDSCTFEDGRLTLEVARIGGRYDGRLTQDGNRIEGTWSQIGGEAPLVLERVE